MKIIEKLQVYYKNAFKNEQYKMNIEILDILFKIDPIIIDNSKSSIVEKNNFLILRLFEEQNLRCPIIVHLGINEKLNKINFFFNHSGAICEENISNENDLQNVKNLIKDFLSSNVKEELTFINKKLIKSKYFYLVELSGKKVELPFSTYKGIVWFWKKKSIITNNYQPWIVSK